MPGRIVLFGATGYTGRLTAEAMVERGMRPVLAARGAGRLEQMAAELGGGLETMTADVSDPPSVRALVEAGDVLVSTVGPFVRFGGPAAAAASSAGAHYLDSTGEPPFIREVFERYGAAAASTTPACSRPSATTGCRETWPERSRSTARERPRCAWTPDTSSPARPPRTR